jgi:hypothetical protein
LGVGTLLAKDCPTINPTMTWKQYFAQGLGGVAGVQFQFAKKLNNPAAISGLHTKVCFVVRYSPKSKTYEGYIDGSNPTAYKSNQPGNPLQNEVNVWGVILMFNERGEIYNYEGDVVGKLVCYLANDACAGY